MLNIYQLNTNFATIVEVAENLITLLSSVIAKKVSLHRMSQKKLDLYVTEQGGRKPNKLVQKNPKPPKSDFSVRHYILYSVVHNTFRVPALISLNLYLVGLIIFFCRKLNCLIAPKYNRF